MSQKKRLIISREDFWTIKHNKNSGGTKESFLLVEAEYRSQRQRDSYLLEAKCITKLLRSDLKNSLIIRPKLRIKIIYKKWNMKLSGFWHQTPGGVSKNMASCKNQSKLTFKPVYVLISSQLRLINGDFQVCWNRSLELE